MADDVMAVWWRMGLTEQGMAVEYVAHGSEVRRRMGCTAAYGQGYQLEGLFIFLTRASFPRTDFVEKACNISLFFSNENRRSLLISRQSCL
jgi:hypothetical protein